MKKKSGQASNWCQSSTHTQPSCWSNHRLVMVVLQDINRPASQQIWWWSQNEITISTITTNSRTKAKISPATTRTWKRLTNQLTVGNQSAELKFEKKKRKRREKGSTQRRSGCQAAAGASDPTHTRTTTVGWTVVFRHFRSWIDSETTLRLLSSPFSPFCDESINFCRPVRRAVKQTFSPNQNNQSMLLHKQISIHFLGWLAFKL